MRSSFYRWFCCKLHPSRAARLALFYALFGPNLPLKGCLPPDPRQTDRVADSGAGTGERVSAGDRVSVVGHRRCDRRGVWRDRDGRRSHVAWRAAEAAQATGRLPSPGPVTSAMCVWRGSGGRPLPRLPRRRAGPSAAAEGPVSHGRGGREEKSHLGGRGEDGGAMRQRGGGWHISCA